MEERGQERQVGRKTPGGWERGGRRSAPGGGEEHGTGANICTTPAMTYPSRLPNCVSAFLDPVAEAHER